MDFSYGREVSEIVNTGEKNLFAGSDTIVLGKYSPGAGTIRADISANTRTGNRSFSKEFSVIPKAANSFIPSSAYTTINSLLDRIEVEGENEALVSEVTGLALEFGFVTPYTSLFVELPELANPETIDSVSEEVMEMPAEGEALMDGAMSTPSAGQPKPAASSPYDRNAVYEGAMAEEPVEEAEEAATPGFEVSLALSGLLGIAFCFRKR
ncbi:PGF-CTERM sorting domain-containing protein [Methanosarcina horonobensis]|uniref:PGF-CTERM sorting domain-containing protein n=1 Tax=Methanosarcina horonobensis TaxID=418008 RepID=UPI000A502E14|nr:PGF-CTERM sorting domain-containing protein [Methanosarcina horonobensis]